LEKINLQGPVNFLLVSFVIDTSWQENARHGYIRRMGVAYLASHLKKAGHNAYICYCPYTDDQFTLTAVISRHIEKANPDVIGFSITTDNFWMLQTAVKHISKSYGLPVIVGGPHAIVDPESVLAIDGVLGVCTGEGEQPIVSLANALSEARPYSSIEGFLFRGRQGEKPVPHLWEDIDTLAYPDMESYLTNYAGILRNGWVFQSQRGCPNHCSFCSEEYFRKVFHGRHYIRHRTVESLIDEIAFTTRNYPSKISRFVGFSNPTFNISRMWVQRFCEQYSSRINLPFGCDIELSNLSEDMADSLAAANCKVAWVGFESGSDFIRKDVLNKKLTVRQAVEKLEILRSRGIGIELYVIMGLPYETEGMIKETLEVLRGISPDAVIPSIYLPFPGTRLGELCFKEGWADRTDVHNATHIPGYSHSTLKYPHIDPAKIQYYYDEISRLNR